MSVMSKQNRKPDRSLLSTIVGPAPRGELRGDTTRMPKVEVKSVTRVADAEGRNEVRRTRGG